jgi:hypothetical protein
MSARWARPRRQDANELLKRSPHAVLAETFTVIHGGAEISASLAAEILGEVTDWATAAESGVSPVVEVWGPLWRRLLAGCWATAAAAGGPLYGLALPAADDLVTGLRARGVAVRYRQARQSTVDDAELRAISQGWPVRYI